MRNSRLRGQAENPNGRNAAEMVNVFRVLTCYEEYCSAGVVEIVGPDLGQFRSLWEGLEVAAERVGAARGGGCDGREDEIVVLPERVDRKPLFVLMCPVLIWLSVGLTCRLAEGPPRAISFHIRAKYSSTSGCGRGWHNCPARNLTAELRFP